MKEPGRKERLPQHEVIERSCLRKVRYDTEAEAERRTFVGRTAYRCPHCRGWHITSQEKDELYLAQRAVRELERKGIAGPLLRTARNHLASLIKKDRK